jgi:hypothetical protein
MELRTLFPQNTSQNHPHTTIESHANGNKKLSLNAMSTFNGVGSDNCGSVPIVPGNLRLSRGFYSRLPPLGRSGTNAGLNSVIDSKQQKEPSENKINCLFDQYKVNTYVFLFVIHINFFLLQFNRKDFIKIT